MNPEKKFYTPSELREKIEEETAKKEGVSGVDYFSPSQIKEMKEKMDTSEAEKTREMDSEIYEFIKGGSPLGEKLKEALDTGEVSLASVALLVYESNRVGLHPEQLANTFDEDISEAWDLMKQIMNEENEQNRKQAAIQLRDL